MTIADKQKFIKEYMKSQNAATGSKFDANSNVTHKNIATLSWEVPKDNIELNRAMFSQTKRNVWRRSAESYLKDWLHDNLYP